MGTVQAGDGPLAGPLAPLMLPFARACTAGALHAQLLAVLPVPAALGSLNACYCCRREPGPARPQQARRCWLPLRPCDPPALGRLGAVAAAAAPPALGRLDAAAAAPTSPADTLGSPPATSASCRPFCRPSSLCLHPRPSRCCRFCDAACSLVAVSPRTVGTAGSPAAQLHTTLSCCKHDQPSCPLSCGSVSLLWCTSFMHQSVAR